MKKSEAISLFGSPKRLSKALGVTRQAVSQWPDNLPQWQSDRIVGAAIRAGIYSKPRKRKLPEVPEWMT